LQPEHAKEYQIYKKENIAFAAQVSKVDNNKEKERIMLLTDFRILLYQKEHLKWRKGVLISNNRTLLNAYATHSWPIRYLPNIERTDEIIVLQNQNKNVKKKLMFDSSESAQEFNEVYLKMLRKEKM